MKLRYGLFGAGALIAAFAIPAIADVNYTQGSGTVLFDFICFSTKHCAAHVPVNSAGTEIGTNTNPIRIDPNGTTTQPVSAASLPLPSGAATATNQTTANTSLASIDSKAGSPIPNGTNSIGNVSSDPSVGKATPTFASLSMSTATTTQIVALSGSLKTYVTSLHVMAGGTANVTFKYGTGTNCGTGTTTLDGPYPLTAQAGMAIGSGTGAVLIVPAGQALCVTSDAAVQVTTGLTHQQI